MSLMINGFGTGTIGRLEQPDGSFRTTEWVLFFFVPIIPLRTYRVVAEGQLGGIPFVYLNRPFRAIRLPLGIAHVLRIYMGLGVTVGILFGLGWLLRRVSHG